uniref:Uncharacterized protein n=1 Tax=Arundo donax TaxID=35708 RepID=A0A0A8YA39_ARUDO
MVQDSTQLGSATTVRLFFLITCCILLSSSLDVNETSRFLLIMLFQNF